MKTTTPRYRVFLKNRPDAHGRYPVILRISFYGTREKSLGFSVRPQDWDTKKQRVRQKAENARVLNSLIDSAIATYEKERMKLDVEGTAYTATTITTLVEQAKEPAPSEMTLQQCLNKYLDAKSSSPRSRTLYQTQLNRVLDVYTRPLVRDVNPSWMDRLTSTMKRNGKSNSVITGTIGLVCSLVNFSNQEGWTRNDNTIFTAYRRKFKYTRMKPRTVLTERQILIMMEWLFDRIYTNAEAIIKEDFYVDVQPQPREDTIDELFRTSSEEFAVAFALLMFYFGGLAPIDLSELKPQNITFKDGKIILNGNRHKTGTPFNVPRTYTTRLRALLQPFLDRATINNSYLLPLLDDHVAKDTVSAFTYQGKKKLNKAIEKINQAIENKDEQIPNNVSFYSFRHSYASCWLTKSSDIGSLAKTMGRSISGISTYCHSLTSEQELAQQVDMIG